MRRRARTGLALLVVACGPGRVAVEAPRVEPPAVPESVPEDPPEPAIAEEPVPEPAPDESEPPPPPPPPMMDIVGRKAPGFALEDMEGGKHRLEELRGKVVVLNFWFIECKPCLAELPHLNRLADAHRDDGVVFLAPSVNERGPLEAFLVQRRFAYRVIPAAFELATSYEVKSYPSHVVIDQGGRITFATGGLQAGTIPALEAEVDRLLDLAQGGTEPGQQ